MPQYTTFDPNVEIIGQNVLGFLECVQNEDVRPHLEKYGLTQIEPDQWYPLQDWLDVLSSMAEDAGGGAMQNFVSIGMKIAETAVYPPEVENLPFEQIVMMIPQVYQMQHRGGDAGEEWVEKLAEGHMVLNMRTPYPDDLAYGVVYGQARRFLPHGATFAIYYDEERARHDTGGDVTALHITWKA